MTRLPGPRLLAAVAVLAGCGAAPVAIGPHPENPRYFLFRDKPAVLMTSGEHYGAILNQDFDFGPYLGELRNRGFNLTRTFSGTYREIAGSFQIRENTLAPPPDRYLAPWLRSQTSGAADGGNKFDLDAFDPAYFARLRAFVVAAGKHEIVVEFVLFCPFYDDSLWNVNPLKAANNVNGVGVVPRTEVYTLKHPPIVARHEAYTRRAVAALREFDNVYFEICNEPYFGGVTADWQARIAATIVDEDAKGDGPRHMIAQNVANGRAKIDHPNPSVSLFNFHYATPPDVIALNAGLNKAIGDDETGFRGVDDRPYRSEAWEFLLAGGSLYSNLDYSFTPDRPAGNAPVTPPTPGGGGPALRKQLSILKSFLDGFDFLHMTPDPGFVVGGVPSKGSVRVLAAKGKAYGLYLNGGNRANLVVDLPAGTYRVDWIDVQIGGVAKGQDLDHKGGRATLSSPAYDGDVALRIVRK